MPVLVGQKFLGDIAQAKRQHLGLALGIAVRVAMHDRADAVDMLIDQRERDAVGIGLMFQQPTQAVRDRLGEREAEGSGLALDVVGGAKHLIA